MPYMPKVPCRHPGCARLVERGRRYCDEHLPEHEVEMRASAARRGYSYKWNVRRKRYLRAHPLCVRCLARGVYTAATVVDHIVPHRGNEALMWDESNWQSLCKPCHDAKTAREDMHPAYSYDGRGE